MFEPFSSGYYLGEMYVQPRASDAAAIKRADHEKVNEQLYATGDGVERLDNPLVMKVGTRHFPVVADDDVPGGTLAVPESSVPDDLKFSLPDRREVFLANADRARDLIQYTGWEDEDYA
ncbi:DUF5802 family protein [Candidatus Halobonum tyrrellensis]|uniref:Uncharacterized protein n=1 Tax=Candidatus Halobonum tyrrellensis G22 TaxID=1324957 RepID=V4HDM1_9EURY|nr:DUF5802 family protein [Candidatus Halobonum tyrrellensis]ESP88173.1 hypothetical protein K933_10195 [Candidatus Halobonum tyrrellensis G22]